MRVLHVVPTLATQYGGPVTAVLGMTAAMAKAGVDIKLFTTDYLSNGPLLKTGCETKAFHCMFGPWQWSPSLGNALQKETRRADLVNIHTLWTYPVAAAARACWSARVPYILRPAGMLDEWSLSKKSLKKKIYTSLIERRTIDRAAALWFTSEEERAGARPFNYQTRDFVMPLGIAREDYRELPAKGVFRKHLLNSTERRIVLFLGRLAPKKQPDLVLRAFADLPNDFNDSILVMAGSGEARYLDELKTMATTLGIHDRVYFTSNLQRQEVVAAFNDADVFVLPSLHENFGVAVIEAMASGTPVIVSDRVGLASVVRQSEAGIVIEPTRDTLKSSIGHILRNPAIGEEMGKRGREVALEKFTWEQIVPALTDVYLQTIGAGTTSRSGDACL